MMGIDTGNPAQHDLAVADALSLTYTKKTKRFEPGLR